MKAFNSAATDLRGGWQPSLSLELALAEVMEPPETSTPQIAATSPSPGTRQTKPQAAPAAATAASASPPLGGTGGGSKPKVEDEAQAPVNKPAISAGEVIKVWKQIAASLPKSQANLSALLNSVRMIDVQGDALILGFASDVLVNKMNKPDQIEAAQKAIADAVGVKLNIRCVVTTAKGKVPPHVEQDGMVATAIRHGGEIVDMD